MHVVGHADDVAPLLRLFGSEAPLRGRLAAQATLGGNLAALQVTGLRVSLDQGAGSTLQATGQIASVTPGGTVLLDGIALEVQGTTAATVLADWLGRPLPDLGPIQGRFTLSGSSRTVALTDLQLQAGTASHLRIAATGGIGEIRLDGPRRSEAPTSTSMPTARDGTIIGAVLEADVPRLGALAYTGRLSGERARWRLTGKARVGRTVIDQDLAVEHEHARPRISGKLSIPTLYLADFGFGSEGAQSERGTPPSLDAALGALDAVDLALHVGLGEVEGTKLPIGRGEMDLTLEDGVLRIDPARFGFVAGTTVVHASANARAQPPQTDLERERRRRPAGRGGDRHGWHRAAHRRAGPAHEAAKQRRLGTRHCCRHWTAKFTSRSSAATST